MVYKGGAIRVVSTSVRATSSCPSASDVVTKKPSCERSMLPWCQYKKFFTVMSMLPSDPNLQSSSPPASGTLPVQNYNTQFPSVHWSWRHHARIYVQPYPKGVAMRMIARSSRTTEASVILPDAGQSPAHKRARSREKLINLITAM